jgi:hypothetical protein
MGHHPVAPPGQDRARQGLAQHQSLSALDKRFEFLAFGVRNRTPAVAIHKILHPLLKFTRHLFARYGPECSVG